ncbi:polynucleotide 5'-hydroxyl-kinase NOL9 [Anoplophora glabripennis]|nr:polynucleotide 5'-hydroxyl-kinase NOL9 [Anoplophora glabripennis]
MNDLIEYEDFLPSVRKSLYGKAQVGVKPNKKAHRKLKKVKFNTDHIRDNNSSKSELQSTKSEKLKSRKNTPFKKKIKKEPLLHEVDSWSQPQKLEKDGHKHIQKKKPKKVVISFSSSSDSFDEDLKDAQLTPSKSELETFQNTINKSFKRKLSDMIESSGEDDEDESGDNFDLETYFNTHEISDLNESVTEAHSGIDHEFLSDYAIDVKIMESDSLCNQKEAVKIETVNVGESDEDLNEDIVSEFSTEKKIELITDKIQEAVIISDDNWKETSFTSLEDSQQFQEDNLLKETNSTDFEENLKFQEDELSNSTAEYHDFGDKKVVVLNRNQSISFHGLFNLKVLYGKIEVLGGILDSSSNAANLYSPRGSALLYIKNVTHFQDTDETINVSQLISTKNNLEKDIFVEANCGVVLCSKLEDTKLLFLEKYVPQKIFPRLENDNAPQVIFEPTGNLNTIKTSSVWDEVLDDVDWNTKLMITGGKGVGKSTLLRFAINRLLNKFDKIRVLDLDPGQSEFTVPGCVSVVTVTEPIFGPNFTHLKKANRSLLSNINVAHDPRAYINCIKSIVAYLETLEECPILINYMGFVQGIGLNIVTSVIKCIQPTGIIQICSKNQKRNFKDDLTYKVVKENCTLFCDDQLELNYKLYKVPALNDENDGWTLEPRQSREMYVLAYFGQMMRNGVNSLTSCDVPMYEVHLPSIKITNLQGEDVAPAVTNANMVALCYLQQELNVFRCMGYGVVRGVDLESNKLVLVTPEEIKVLEDVYYLVMGSVFLPPAIYMAPDDVTGTIPYVMEGELVSLGQITKRSYLPANKK